MKAHFKLGNDSASRAALETMIGQVGEGVLPEDIARLYAYRGETDLAFEWIEKVLNMNPATRQKFVVHPGALMYIEFAGLLDDPRWEMVRQRFPDFDGWDQLRQWKAEALND